MKDILAFTTITTLVLALTVVVVAGPEKKLTANDLLQEKRLCDTAKAEALPGQWVHPDVLAAQTTKKKQLCYEELKKTTMTYVIQSAQDAGISKGEWMKKNGLRYNKQRNVYSISLSGQSFELPDTGRIKNVLDGKDAEGYPDMDDSLTKLRKGLVSG